MAFAITRGEDVRIPVKLKYKSGKSFDLNGRTVTAKLKINNILETLVAPANIEVTNAYEGEFLIKLTDTQTLQLALKKLDIDVYTDLAGDTSIFRIRDLIEVFDRLV